MDHVQSSKIQSGLPEPWKIIQHRTCVFQKFSMGVFDSTVRYDMLPNVFVSKSTYFKGGEVVMQFDLLGDQLEHVMQTFLF